MIDREELDRLINGTVLRFIGNTPIVKINRVNKSGSVEIYAKLECFNPGGSVKDRAALFLVYDALKRGALDGGRIVVEASSGNMAVSVAMVCAVLKLKATLIVPTSISREMRRMIELLGAEIVYTPAEAGTDGAIEVARKLSRPGKYCWLAQHFNYINVEAHYRTTGEEIASFFKKMGRSPDLFVATTGTTGTIMGAGRRLKEEFEGIRVVAVYPLDSIRGIRRPVGRRRPGIYDESIVDRVIEVRNRDALTMVMMLAREEGILAGPSSGAALCASLKLAEELEKDRGHGVIATIFPDGIERYLSTEVMEILSELGKRKNVRVSSQTSRRP